MKTGIDCWGLHEESQFHDVANQMPRTMLHYAIEKFEESERQHWLSVKKV